MLIADPTTAAKKDPTYYSIRTAAVSEAAVACYHPNLAAFFVQSPWGTPSPHRRRNREPPQRYSERKQLGRRFLLPLLHLISYPRDCRYPALHSTPLFLLENPVLVPGIYCASCTRTKARY